MIALDAAERVHEIAVADHEADPPARHVVAFRHREELDGDIARTRHLHDRRRFPAVEANVGVREIVHDVDTIFARQGDDLFEERQLNALRGRIRGEIQNEHPRLGKAHLDRVLELGEEIDSRRERYLTNIGAGDDRPVDVDRIARIGDEHSVAAARCGEHQMRDAFLRPDRDDRFVVGIELDTPAARVPVTDRPPQSRNAFRDRIAVRIPALHRFDELGDDVRRRRTVGISHAEVDDVLAAPACGHLELGGDRKNVRRQARQAREIGFGSRHPEPF